PVRSSCGRGPCRGRSEQAAFHGTYGSLESATGTKTLSDLSRMREGSFSEAITPSRRSLLSSEFGGQRADGADGGVEQVPMHPFCHWSESEHVEHVTWCLRHGENRRQLTTRIQIRLSSAALSLHPSESVCPKLNRIGLALTGGNTASPHKTQKTCRCGALESTTATGPVTVPQSHPH